MMHRLRPHVWTLGFFVVVTLLASLQPTLDPGRVESTR